MTMRRIKEFKGATSAAAIAASLLIGNMSAHAQTIENTSFETGNLDGWNVGGGTGTQAAGSYNSSGVGVTVVTGMTDFQSVAGTAPGSHSWTVVPYDTYMASLQAGGNYTFANGATDLGLTATSQSAVAALLTSNPTNAAWIYQDLLLNAGDSFEMAWQYVSTDYDPFNDASLTSLVNIDNNSILATVNNNKDQYALLGATVLGTGNYSTGNYGATGWQVSTYSVDTSGTYRLGFLSLNLSDTVNSPVLFVDQYTGTTYDKGVYFAPIGPNPGSNAPVTPSGPVETIISGDTNSSDLGDSGNFQGGTLTVDEPDSAYSQDFGIGEDGAVIDQNGNDSTFSGAFNDAVEGTPGSLSITNSSTGGSITLTGTNGYTGDTTIAGGTTLALTGDGSIEGSSKVIADGMFDIGGTNDGASIKTLGGAGEVALGDKSLTITDGSGSFDGAIGGTGGFALTGGDITLTGTNGYTGDTTIAGGTTLALTGDGSIEGSSKVIADGTFDIGGTNDGASITTLGGAGEVALGDKSLTITDGSGSFDGAIGGTGGFALTGGDITLTGTNGYTGDTTIAGGTTLALTGDGSIEGSSKVIADGTFDIGGTNDGASITTLGGAGEVALGDKSLTITDGSGSFDGAIGGTGGFALTGGEITLTGTNGYTGDTTIAGGTTLALTGDGSIEGSSKVIADGTFDIGGTNDGASIKTLGGAGEVALGDKSLTITDGSGSFDGAIGGTGGFALTGGEITLTGTNGYTGDTTIAGGTTLALTGDGSIEGSSKVIADGTFDIGGTNDGASIKTLGGAGEVALGDKSLTITDGSGSFDGAIGGTGGFALTGGEITLTGTNGYTGDTTIAGGTTLALTGDGSIEGSSKVIADGTFDIGGTNDGASITTLGGAGEVALGDKSLTITDGSGSFDGAIGGTGGFALTGGDITLTGTNGYTGDTTIAGGTTLALTGDGSIEGSSKVIADGTFDIGGTNDGASITTLGGAGEVALGDKSLTITDGSGSFDGAIGGTGGFALTGGDITLTGTNGYTGDTTIAGGTTLALTGDGSIEGSSKVIADGTFDIGGTNDGASIKTLGGAGEVALDDKVLTVTDGSGSFDGAIGGTGGFALTGGEITLTGTNGYTGDTTIAGGTTLALTGDGSIEGSSKVIADGTFDIGGTNDGASIKTLGGAGEVALGDKSLTITDGSGSFDGAIGGTGGFALTGGEITLTGTNGYTGDTTIAGGTTLALTGDGSIEGSSKVIADGTFDIGGTNDGASIKTLGGAGEVALGDKSLTITDGSGSFDGAIGGTGGFALTGGEITLTGTNGYTGDTTIAGGTTLALTGDGSIEGSSKVIADGTFDIGGTNDGASITTLGGAGEVALDDKVLTVTDGSGSFDGAIGGTGGFALTGGDITLTGTNGYTGDTTIAGGTTLALTGDGSIEGSSKVIADGTFDIGGTNDGASIKTLGGAGEVALDDKVLTVTDGSGSFDGAIGGTGGFALTGGEITLTGTNGYTGDTTIAGGTTLALTGDGSIEGSSKVIADGTFDIGGTNDGASIKTLGGAGEVALGDKSLTITDGSGSFDGAIGGTGGFALTGGELTLNGTNTYTGGTTIAGGTLIGSTNSLTGDVLDNAALVIDQDSDGGFSGDISGSGSLTKDGTGAVTLTGANSYTGGTIIAGGTLIGSANSLTGDVLNNAALELAQPDDATFDGTLYGSGSLLKSGAGTLTISGAHGFSGNTTVSAGGLTVDGDLRGSAITLQDGTMLAGSGIVGGIDAASGSMVSVAGDGLGTMLVDGDVAFASGSNLIVNANAAGEADMLSATGTVTIAGGTVQVLAAYGDYAPQTGYTIISGGTVEGSFDNVQTDLAFLMPTLQYSATGVGLVLTRNDIAFADIAVTYNQASVGGAINAAFASESELYYAIVGQSAKGARAILDNLSGEIHATVANALVQDSDRNRRAVLGRLDLPKHDGPALWIQGVGAQDDWSSDRNAAGYQRNSTGVIGGLELTRGKSKMGIAIGYTDGSLKLRDRLSNAKISGKHLDLYAGSKLGPINLSAGAQIADFDVDTNRDFSLGSIDQQAAASYDAKTYGAFARAGIQMPLGNGAIEPFIGVNWIRFDRRGFAENGGTLALDGMAEKSNWTFGSIGFKSQVPLDPAKRFAVTFSGEWQHALDGKATTATMRFAAGDPSFTVAGAPLARDAAIVDIAANYKLSDRLTIGAGYSGTIANYGMSNAGRANVSLRF